MKVLLRSDYTWHEAKWDYASKGFMLKGTTNILREFEVISVKDDNRNKYVFCSNCGEIILNTPSAIKKHQQLSDSSKTCLTCSSCRQSNEKELSKKYTGNPDGTYDVTIKKNVKLYCHRGFWYDDDHKINSESARKGCKYARCKTAKIETYKDIFSKYPGAFDDILTVDVLVKNKWEFVGRNPDGYSIFKIPMKFNFFAIVNLYGFIDKFYYAYRCSDYQFMYSPKYAKIIWVNWKGYQENKPVEVSDSVVDKITKKIAELYKEADKNE